MCIGRGVLFCLGVGDKSCFPVRCLSRAAAPAADSCSMRCRAPLPPSMPGAALAAPRALACRCAVPGVPGAVVAAGGLLGMGWGFGGRGCWWAFWGWCGASCGGWFLGALWLLWLLPARWWGRGAGVACDTSSASNACSTCSAGILWRLRHVHAVPVACFTCSACNTSITCNARKGRFSVS